MIRTFRDRKTERVFRRERSRKFSADVARRALMKMHMIDAAESLNDLRAAPGNRLERLSGDRKGEFSIRINNQRRICFRWTNGDANDVEIVDYH